MSLPPPSPEGWPAADEALITVTFKAWIDFAREHLHLEFFELRELVAIKGRRDADAGDWARINRALEAVGRRRAGAPFSLASRLGDGFDPRDFARNLREALGREPDFHGLEEVEEIDDLFHLRDREEVRRFLRDPPYDALASVPEGESLPVLARDVVEMMSRKQRIEAEWAQINAYLSAAGRRLRGDPGFRVEDREGFDPEQFEANLAYALPELDFGALPPIGERQPARGAGEYMAVIAQIEGYLYMQAEAARFLLDQAFPRAGERGDRPLWAQADAILAGARARKAIEQRRHALRVLREAEPDPEQSLRAVLTAALGLAPEPRPPLSSILDRALPHLAAEADRSLLGSWEEAITKAPPDAAEWERLVGLAELIQRARLGGAQAPLERRTWIDLHAYEDATQVVPETAEGAAAAAGRWPSFGRPRATSSREEPPPPVLGWAMSSPVLAMRQGIRRIVLELRFHAGGLGKDRIDAAKALFADNGPGAGPLDVQLSGPEGWMAPDSADIEPPEDPGPGDHPLTLVLDLEFSASRPAITAPPSALGVPSRFPVLRLMVRSRWDEAHGRFRSPYPELRVLRLAWMRCRVTVGDPSEPESGLMDPLLRNDQSLIDPGKPFEPFGQRPAVGSRLAIADPELATKRLETVSFELPWMGVPAADLKKYYQDYTQAAELANDAFTVEISVVDRRTAVSASDRPLFDSDDATQAARPTVGELDEELVDVAPPLLEDRMDRDPARWPRYLRWELSPVDFQHAVYPAEAARKSPAALNPPYTPRLKFLGVGYSARSTWDPAAGIGLDEGEAMLLLHPFGCSEALDERADSRPFLPAYDHSGELLIGLADLDPPQRVTLLFQVAEGSADPDLTPAPVAWSYLDGEDWVPLEQGRLRRDGTRGLINSGIVELDLPPAAAGRLLPAGRYWLRVAVRGRPRSLCDTVGVAAQAVSARFADRGNDPGHFAQPLPAGSITKPLHPIPGIARIRQPYTSFGARPAESPEALWTRAAERLRHRNRALAPWDYERLVLERFPQLHTAKCLPAGTDGHPLGTARMVVIPDIARQRPSDPFAPKAPADLLADIARFLRARQPACAGVRVDNAVFVPVKIRVGIRFHDSVDAGLARAELIEALNRYLSPWAFEEGAEIVIGGAIYANSIIDFLERQPGVDYVHEPKLFRFDAAGGRFRAVARPPAGAGGYHVAAGGADQVLVAASHHDIDIIRPGLAGEEELTGIGYMKVGLDFVVAETRAAGA